VINNDQYTDLFSFGLLQWTPDAKTLLAASSKGDITLWNGLTAKFETTFEVPFFLLLDV